MYKEKRIVYRKNGPEKSDRPTDSGDRLRLFEKSSGMTFTKSPGKTVSQEDLAADLAEMERIEAAQLKAAETAIDDLPDEDGLLKKPTKEVVDFGNLDKRGLDRIKDKVIELNEKLWHSKAFVRRTLDGIEIVGVEENYSAAGDKRIHSVDISANEDGTYNYSTFPTKGGFDGVLAYDDAVDLLRNHFRHLRAPDSKPE